MARIRRDGRVRRISTAPRSRRSRPGVCDLPPTPALRPTCCGWSTRSRRPSARGEDRTGPVSGPPRFTATRRTTPRRCDVSAQLGKTPTWPKFIYGRSVSRRLLITPHEVEPCALPRLVSLVSSPRQTRVRIGTLRSMINKW